jgi:hypothetical protein
MVDFLRWAVGASVWLLANAVYYDMRRKDVKGFGRVVAFFAGYPLTWLTLFAVKEGQVAALQPPSDDDERLLREVQIDRKRRSLAPPSGANPEAAGGDG